MKKWPFFFIMCLVFTEPAGISAQEREIYELPPWLILEYGRKAFSEQELGVALRYAREAIEKSGHFYPEAEILIGDVFGADGNDSLALRQYEKALDNSRQLYILEDKYRILYKIAAIHKDRGNELRYEQTLMTVLEDDEMYNEAIRTDLGAKMISTLREEGLDKLLVLYRLQSHPSLQAHSELGMINAEQDELEQAALHYIFSIVTVFSRCIEEYKIYDPVYIFEDGNNFLSLTKRYGAIQEYIAETELYLDLFYLGLIISELGADGEIVRDIWEISAEHSESPRLIAAIEEQLDSF